MLVTMLVEAMSLEKKNLMQENILALKVTENSFEKENSCCSIALVPWPTGDSLSGDNLGIHFNTQH